jgi:hypothetical protein
MVAEISADWDCRPPSDVALQLPGHDAPTILLSSRAEVEQAGFSKTFASFIRHILGGNWRYCLFEKTTVYHALQPDVK